MNNLAQEAILAISALAEVCGEFYRQLLNQGFSQAEALSLTSEYVKAAVTPRPKTDS